MPNAIPCRNEVVLARKFPCADIGVMECNVRMALFRQLDHPTGDIETLYLKPIADQKIDDPPAASTTDIESATSLFQESESALVLLDAIVSRKFIAIPLVGELVITFRSEDRRVGKDV